jgi:phosphate transport system substrate-binding protein
MAQKIKTSVKRTMWTIIGLMLLIAVAIIYDKATKGKIPLPKITYSNTTGSSNANYTTSTSVPDGNLILKLGGESVMAESFAPNLIKSYLVKNGYSNVQIIVNQNDGGKYIIGEKNGKKDKIEILPKKDDISALNSGQIDIYMTSTELQHSSYKEYEVGMDAIAIVVNKKSKVQYLSEDDLQDIFTSASMTLYCNTENSCTYKTFKEYIMEDKAIHTSHQKFQSDAEIIDAVAKDENGIGIISFSNLTSAVKVLPVSEEKDLPPIIPNKSTIESERYTLSKDLYFYINKSSQLAQSLCSYIETTEGQNIVSQEGFINLNISLNNNSENPEIMPNDPPEYTSLIKNDQKITSEFRFETGSSVLDSRGLNDIARLVGYLSDHKGEQVVLVGFTDNIGDPASNIKLSISRANTVKTILTSSGVSVYQVLGFGSARPVRSNNNDADRAENRRVEVWLKN